MSEAIIIPNLRGSRSKSQSQSRAIRLRKMKESTIKRMSRSNPLKLPKRAIIKPNSFEFNSRNSQRKRSGKSNFNLKLRLDKLRLKPMSNKKQHTPLFIDHKQETDASRVYTDSLDAQIKHFQYLMSLSKPEEGNPLLTKKLEKDKFYQSQISQKKYSNAQYSHTKKLQRKSHMQRIFEAFLATHHPELSSPILSQIDRALKIKLLCNFKNLPQLKGLEM